MEILEHISRFLKLSAVARFSDHLTNSRGVAEPRVSDSDQFNRKKKSVKLQQIITLKYKIIS